jgi:hypothetical protein
MKGYLKRPHIGGGEGGTATTWEWGQWNTPPHTKSRKPLTGFERGRRHSHNMRVASIQDHKTMEVEKWREQNDLYVHTQDPFFFVALLLFRGGAQPHGNGGPLSMSEDVATPPLPGGGGTYICTHIRMQRGA